MGGAVQPAPYRPETAILELGPDFYDPVRPADFPQAILRYRNQVQAAGVCSISAPRAPARPRTAASATAA